MKTVTCSTCKRIVLANDDNTPVRHADPSGRICAGSVVMLMSFDKWCTGQMMSRTDRQAFKAWLGSVVNTRMSEANWLKFFSEWQDQCD